MLGSDMLMDESDAVSFIIWLEASVLNSRDIWKWRLGLVQRAIRKVVSRDEMVWKTSRVHFQAFGSYIWQVAWLKRWAQWNWIKTSYKIAIRLLGLRHWCNLVVLGESVVLVLAWVLILWGTTVIWLLTKHSVCCFSSYLWKVEGKPRWTYMAKERILLWERRRRTVSRRA